MIPPIAVILSWPIIATLSSRGWGPGAAVIFCVLGGYLFLPEQTAILLPLLPEIDKWTVPTLTALFICIAIVSRNRSDMGLAGWLPRQRVLQLLLCAIVMGSFLTVLANRDPVPTLLFGTLPALRFYDACSELIWSIVFCIPLLLGRKFLGTPEGHRLVLTGLCIAGLIYTPLIMFEVRMSPQLSNMIYGIFPHSFIQHVRGDGYRPIVFLSHGLRVSIFMCITVIAAVGMIRLCKGKMRQRYIMFAAILFVALVLSKSVGAIMIALVLCPIALFLSVRLQMLVAALLALMVILYPISRGTSLVPVAWVQQKAMELSPERGGSFATRLHFEELLLERAQERPLLGWGGWGRSRLTDQFTISDGQWVITLGTGGWFGFLSNFGLMGVPAMLLWWRRRRDGIGVETSMLCLAMAGCMVDLIPNSGITPDKMLLAGALWGRLELGRIADTGAAPTQTNHANKRASLATSRPRPASGTSIYTRQTHKIHRKTGGGRSKT